MAATEFAYGTAPNRWLEAQAAAIPAGGRVLCLGEGEGRNAVWLAQRGFSVVAVDASPVGLEKARRLAAERGVTIETRVADLASYRPEPAAYDATRARLRPPAPGHPPERLTPRPRRRSSPAGS